MRRTGVLLVTVLLVSGAAVVGGVTSASAAPLPPRTGNVSCALNGDSTFSPWLGYSPGRGDPKISPDRDSKWKVVGNLTGCTGSQTGGDPKQGSIATGDLLIKATAVDHTCQKVTDFGLTLTRLRVRWKDAQGRNLKNSLGTGTVTTSGLYNGYPYLAWASPFHHPGYVSPGIVTVSATGTIDPAAKVFPGKTFTFSGTVDRTLESMAYPCSHFGPPVRGGIGGFGFTGVNGPTSLSIG